MCFPVSQRMGILRQPCGRFSPLVALRSHSGSARLLVWLLSALGTLDLLYALARGFSVEAQLTMGERALGCRASSSTRRSGQPSTRFSRGTRRSWSATSASTPRPCYPWRAHALARDLGPKGVHVAYFNIDAVIDVPWTRDRFHPDKPEEFFIKPCDIVDEVFRVPRSACLSTWRFCHLVRSGEGAISACPRTRDTASGVVLDLLDKPGPG